MSFLDASMTISPLLNLASVLSWLHSLSSTCWKHWVVYAKDPSKHRPFSEEFDVLGVRINASSVHSGIFTLANKPSRVDKVIELINDIKKLGKVDKKKAQVIRGLLNFMASFAVGHSVKLACRVFASAFSAGSRWSRHQVCHACDFTLECLANLRGRTVDVRGERKPVLIFTGAAFEGGVSTYGVVIVDEVSSKRDVFGGEIPQHLTDFWLQWGAQVIAQAEAFAMLVVRIGFRSALHNRRVIFFVDNESRRYSCIKTLSDSQSLMRIIQLFHQSSEIDHAIMWVEHVPSESNIADLPSRGLQHQSASIIHDPPLDIEAAAMMCKDLSALPSFTFSDDISFGDYVIFQTCLSSKSESSSKCCDGRQKGINGSQQSFSRWQLSLILQRYTTM